MTQCICSYGADPGCRICRPDRWIEYSSNCWRVKKESEMISEQDPKQEATQKRNMSKEANAGMARNDSSTATRLLDKNWSPLIVRKYQMEGWPMYIGIICDANLNDLDEVVYKIMDEAKTNDFVNGTIQGIRNTCGLLSDRIVSHYNEIKRGVAEGVIVCWYVDKCFVSSAYGDFMTHEKCAMEFYQIVNTLPHI